MMDNITAIWRVPAKAEGKIGLRASAIEMVPAPSTLDEATRRLPPGGYTTFRTYGSRRVLRLADHIERLETAAKLAGKPTHLDGEQFRQDLHRVLERSADDVRVRVILDLHDEPGTIYYLVEPLRVPSRKDYEQGVKAATRTMQRTRPEAKLTNFVEKAETVRGKLPPGTNEALMVSKEGYLLEGLSSNFFAVRGAVVWTANQGMLPGITRSLVLEVIEELGIALRLEAVRSDELDAIDEAFITSASRAVLPVTRIDGQPVGDGLPGPLTLRILDRFRQRIEDDLEIV